MTNALQIYKALLTVREERNYRRAERTIAKGLKSFLEVGAALKAIRDGRLYRQEFDTFEEYCIQRWALCRARAYQLCAASKVVADLSTIVDITSLPENEAQVRPLTLLRGVHQRRQAWEKALALSRGRSVTARDVSEAVRLLARPANGNGHVSAEPEQARKPDSRRLCLGMYRTVLADPPWPYTSPCAVIQTDVGQHYPVMSLDQLSALPVARLCQEEAHLYLWMTNSFVCEAHDLARSWGFVPKTIITWGKVRKTNKEFVPSMKTGWWFRSATEHCLFAVRGSLRLQCEEGLPTLLLHERLPHSVKPEAFYDLIEMASPGPYLELFARRRRDAWDAWGNQVQGSIEFPRNLPG